MKRGIVAVFIVVSSVSISAIELIEERRWEIDLQGYPSVVTEYDSGEWLLGVENQVFRWADETLELYQKVEIPDGHVVVDIDYSEGQLAIVSGYLGGPSELSLIDSDDRKIQYSSLLLFDESQVAIRQATWVSGNQILVEYFRRGSVDKPGGADLAIIDTEIHNVEIRLAAPNLRLLAASQGAASLLVVVHGEDRQVTTQFHGDNILIVDDPEFIVRAVAISETEFLLMGVDSLHYLSIFGSEVTVTPLEPWQLQIVSMHYSRTNNSLYILSDPAGTGLLLVRYRISRE